MIRKTPPHTVVANNDHEDTLRTTDVIVYEAPVQGMPPATNPRPADEIVTILKMANAGNALFPLNVAPDLSGRIPDPYVDRLKEIGQLH